MHSKVSSEMTSNHPTIDNRRTAKCSKTSFGGAKWTYPRAIFPSHVQRPPAVNFMLEIKVMQVRNLHNSPMVTLCQWAMAQQICLFELETWTIPGPHDKHKKTEKICTHHTYSNMPLIDHPKWTSLTCTTAWAKGRKKLYKWLHSPVGPWLCHMNLNYSLACTWEPCPAIH